MLDLLWYVWAWWRLRNLRRRRVWRAVLTAFFLLMIINFAWLILNRGMHLGTSAPAFTLGIAYIWHLLVLPVLALMIAATEAGIAVCRAAMLMIKGRKSAAEPVHKSGDAVLSRREFLAATAVAVPPALTIITGSAGYAQTHRFRITHADVDIPGLPPELDGATIAHLSDVHAGRFTNEKMLKRIVAATNDLRADIILMTGDLIDYALADLPNALDAMRRLDSPGGVYLCEGNHDLFESRSEFERQVRASGLEILINQSRDITLRGYPVQLHGLRWGGKGSPHGYRRDGGASDNLQLLKPNFDPDRFSVVLAHHPHAFDAAAKMGIPLTLAGHTHGGQLMLTDQIGAGPLMFKYWSGLYRQGPARMVVSNGVGNWLPLRINAPAEIARLTLRSTAFA